MSSNMNSSFNDFLEGCFDFNFASGPSQPECAHDHSNNDLEMDNLAWAAMGINFQPMRNDAFRFEIPDDAPWYKWDFRYLLFKLNDF
jgi:hypothetical protein